MAQLTGSGAGHGTNYAMVDNSVDGAGEGRLFVNNVVDETTPIDTTKNNPAWSFIYDENNNVGSVYQMIGTGSFVNVLTWSGFSGAGIGIGSNFDNISQWSEV